MQEIDLFYIADNGSIISTRFTQDTQTWTPNSLDYIPGNGSNLATVWFRHDHCNACSNDLLLVIQNSDDKLALFNSTANGDQWTTLDANPMPGTGLTFNVQLGRNHTGLLLLFYQNAGGELCSAEFEASYGWYVNESNPISELSSQAPLASFSSNGCEYLDIVSTGASGVMVNYFNLTRGVWSSMPRSGMLAQVEKYSAIAANAGSFVYALQAGKVKEYQLASGRRWNSRFCYPIAFRYIMLK